MISVCRFIKIVVVVSVMAIVVSSEPSEEDVPIERGNFYCYLIMSFIQLMV